MRILQIIDSLKLGGAERVVVDISNLLVLRGHDTSVLLLRESGKLEAQLSSDVKLFKLPVTNKYNPVFWKKLFELIKSFDILHVHMRHNYAKIKFLSLVSPLKGKIVFHDHFGDIEFDKEVKFYMKHIFTPDIYIGVSSDLCSWANQSLKVSEANIHKLPNTIFREAKSSTDKVMSKSRIICVSNLRETKNLEFAIELAKLNNFQLDIFGQIIDEKYFAQLKEKSNENIRFITSCSDIFSELGNYSLAIHTAFSETGPLVILEYLKYGLNFVTFDTGEVPKVIKSDLPRTILSNHDLTEWSKSISELQTRPYSKNEIKNVFEKYFSVNHYYLKLIKIYK